MIQSNYENAYNNTYTEPSINRTTKRVIGSPIRYTQSDKCDLNTLNAYDKTQSFPVSPVNSKCSVHAVDSEFPMTAVHHIRLQLNRTKLFQYGSDSRDSEYDNITHEYEYNYQASNSFEMKNINHYDYKDAENYIESEASNSEYDLPDDDTRMAYGNYLDYQVNRYNYTPHDVVPSIDTTEHKLQGGHSRFFTESDSSNLSFTDEIHADSKNAEEYCFQQDTLSVISDTKGFEILNHPNYADNLNEESTEEDLSRLAKSLKLNRDYASLAKEYEDRKFYSDLDTEVLCINCNRLNVETIFLPCEHRCICSSCLLYMSKEVPVDEVLMKSEISIHMKVKIKKECPICDMRIGKILELTCFTSREKKRAFISKQKYYGRAMQLSSSFCQQFSKNTRNLEEILKKKDRNIL